MSEDMGSLTKIYRLIREVTDEFDQLDTGAWKTIADRFPEAMPYLDQYAEHLRGACIGDSGASVRTNIKGKEVLTWSQEHQNWFPWVGPEPFGRLPETIRRDWNDGWQRYFESIYGEDEPPLDWFYPNQGYGDDRSHPYFGHYPRWAVCLIPGGELAYAEIICMRRVVSSYSFLWDGNGWSSTHPLGLSAGPLPVGTHPSAEDTRLMSWIGHDVL